MAYAMDLTPLLRDSRLPVANYTREYVKRFQEDIEDRITHLEVPPSSEPAPRYERCL
jgi:hypothetical protein